MSCESNPLVDEFGVSSKVNNEAAINVEHRDNKSSTSSDNYTRLGAAYLSKNNYETALVKLKKALKLNGDNAKAYNYLGILYERLDKPILADKYFKKSEQLSPLNSAILRNYASFLCAQKRYKEASILFNKVFANPLYDRLSGAYQVSADCDLEVLDYKSAEKKYKKALKLDNQNALAMLGMSKLYYRRDNFKIAQYYFKRYEEISRLSPDGLWLGINLQRRLGDKNKVSSYILELKNLYPDSDQTLFLVEGKDSY
jgi:type IV pilus assembly protein PilF